MLVSSGMDDTFLLLKEDHTGVLRLAGNDSEITWDEEGNIAAFGQNLYKEKLPLFFSSGESHDV